jgi:hypothetical protein
LRPGFRGSNVCPVARSSSINQASGRASGAFAAAQRPRCLLIFLSAEKGTEIAVALDGSHVFTSGDFGL